VLDGELIFVPDKIPRRGRFALWGTGSTHPRSNGKLELAFPRGTDAMRKRMVAAQFIPLAQALPELLAIDPGKPGQRHSASVWRPPPRRESAWWPAAACCPPSKTTPTSGGQARSTPPT
jgi:hypothetical protein